MRRSPAYSLSPSDRLIVDLNTTPLIDVMLVLLIMFIITVPVTTHKIPIDPPTSSPPVERAETVVHRLALQSSGALLWNGAPVAEAELPRRLATVSSDPSAELHLSADGEARYEDFDRILAIIKRGGIDRLGFVGNDRFRI